MRKNKLNETDFRSRAIASKSLSKFSYTEFFLRYDKSEMLPGKKENAGC